LFYTTINWLRSLSISRSPAVVAAVVAVIAAVAAVIAALAAVVAVVTTVAAVIAVAAVVTVGAAVVEDEVAAGSLLDHGEVLELLSQPVDPKGETLMLGSL
jgi:hypothetical protein